MGFSKGQLATAFGIVLERLLQLGLLHFTKDNPLRQLLAMDLDPPWQVQPALQ